MELTMVRCCGRKQGVSARRATRWSGFAHRPAPSTSNGQLPSTLTFKSSVSNSRKASDADTKARINAYLFYEFGIEGEETSVNEEWPFRLREILGLAIGATDLRMFAFSNGYDTFFVEVGASLSFWMADGMSTENLELYALGANWIAERQPVD